MASPRYRTLRCYNKKCRRGHLLDLTAYMSGERIRCSCGMEYEYDGQRFRPVAQRRRVDTDVSKASVSDSGT